MTGVPSCRVCGDPLSPPRLQYGNMPAAAQFMPKRHELSAERGIDLAVAQCTSCGLVQLMGEPVHYYREVVRASDVSADMREFRLAQFRAFAAEHDLVGRSVLEVGCGRGDYLALLRDAGMEATGLEHAPHSVEACRRDGLPVHQGFIDGATYLVPGAPYAGFCILNFLEHLPEPRETLRGIAANLAPGAIGLVEVPNFDMIVEKGLFAEFVADHLLYFTEATLRQTLASSGFEVIACRSIWQDYILSATVRKRSPVAFDVLDAHRSVLIRDVTDFLDRSSEKRVALWGAGHQALALVSLLALKERLAYVVDSAAFKQNCFTPATHLPIVAPQALRDDPVDAVLVAAGSYSDEVVGILRRDFDPALEVAILHHDGVRPR